MGEVVVCPCLPLPLGAARRCPSLPLGGLYLGPRWPKTGPLRKADIFHFQNSRALQSTAYLSKPVLMAFLVTT